LKLVQCLGAGVDHLISLPLPKHVDLARLIDKSQIEGFVHYVTGAVLTAHRDFHCYRRSQANGLWEPRVRVQASDRIVGVMGLGEMGSPCALELARQGFPVRGWSRSRKLLEGVSVYNGPDTLNAFLSGVHILVCALPLTADTRDILNSDLFACLAPGAYVINVGRGGHCAERDLIAAIESGQLSGALLDVAKGEPLPPDSVLWRTPGIEINPHMATTQAPQSAALAAAENIKRVRSGRQPLGLIDRTRQY
jgi:glyoxylate/hydroxypyruvate reductase A